VARSPLVILVWVLVWLNVLTETVVESLAAETEEQTGAESPSPPSSVLAPDVVVTATRSREAVAHVPAAPTILTRDEIERTPFADGHQVDDLLRYVPGVQPTNLSSRYNHPTAQAVTLRGLGNGRTLVLLDGVPLNDGFGGWINWGLVPDTLERVEVVPGGGSNLYGTWAMGGIIHLITQQPVAGKGLRAESSAGNLNTYTQALSGRYGTDRLAFSLGYRWYHTNGFITVPDYQRGPIDRADDSRHENFNGTLSAALTSRTRLTLTGNLFREDRSFGTPLSLATRTIGSGAVGLEGDTRRGDHWETKLFAQWQTFRNLTSQVISVPTIRRVSEFQDRIQVIPSNDFGGLSQWAVQVAPQHRLVVGTDARAILGQSEESIFTMTGPAGRSLARGKQVGWGVFGEWIAMPTERLTVIPSFRTDWWKNFDGRIESEQGTVRVPRDNVVNVLNPKLALQYKLTDGLTAGASAYQAFRAPTLNELYRGFSFGGATFLPNENLTPERLTGGEAKLEGALLGNSRLSWRATGHYDEVKDQILFVTQGSGIFMRQNVGRTRTVGGELALGFKASEFASLNVGYAFADSVITSFPGNPTLEGKRIPNVSRHQATIGLTLGHPDWVEVTLMGRYLSRQFADVLNMQPTADFVVLDASAQKRLGKGMRLFLNGENLTDRQYIATQTGQIKTLGTPLLVMGGLRLEY
jgi:outer membrane receptor protein involved in Fe transport